MKKKLEAYLVNNFDEIIEINKILKNKLNVCKYHSKNMLLNIERTIDVKIYNNELKLLKKTVKEISRLLEYIKINRLK